MSKGGKRAGAGRKKLKEPRNIYKRLTHRENELIEQLRKEELLEDNNNRSKNGNIYNLSTSSSLSIKAEEELPGADKE